MRPIKFRAWDKENERWVDHNQHLDESHVTASVRPPSILSFSRDDWDYQQFTGLLDKNGKEIYEGDVVEIIDTNGLSESKKVKVVWNDEMTGYGFDEAELFDGEYWMPFCQEPYACEVLGNIYENPELLKL